MALSLSLGERVAVRLRKRVFSAYLQQPAPWYDTTPTGSMVSTLGLDIEVIQAAITRMLGARVRPSLLPPRYPLHVPLICSEGCSRLLLQSVVQNQKCKLSLSWRGRTCA